MTAGTVPPLKPHIEAANFTSAHKEIARGCDCSLRTARRIVETGRAPGPVRAALIAFLTEALRRNRERIADRERQLHELEHETSLPPAAAGDPARRRPAPLAACGSSPA